MDFYEDLVYSKLFWATTVLFGVYLYLKYIMYNCWSRNGVPHDSPSIPLGNVPFSYFTENVPHGEIIKSSYEKYKNHRYHGLYILNEPILVVNDPELIRLILVKNFTNFCNRGTYYNESTDPLSCALPRLVDDKWKRLRAKLSPTFTSGSLKKMYPMFKEICDKLVKTFDTALDESDVLEMKDIASRFTMDCISSIVLGFNVNSLQNPEHEFRKYGKIVNDFGKVFVLLSFYVPDMIDFYSFIPKKRKKVHAFFVYLFQKTVAYRRAKKIVRNDFLNMLMQLMDRGYVENEFEASSTNVSDDDRLSMTEAVAQSVIFFAAGQETTSSALCCCLYELALHQDVQKKLQWEIDQAFASPEGLTYEKIFEMPYLDMVLCETLRKHPGAPVLNRISLADLNVPDSKFRIPKGMRLVIPVNGIHSDPNVYPDPDRFDPSRFTPENRAKRHPLVYLPFGEGPRHCIGKRLGVLKPKIALCYLLKNYSFFSCDKTQPRLSYMSNSFVQVPAGGVYLRVERRRQERTEASP
ncbi:probable cytochrome P450 6a13 [Nasonia vitripennis]|uniref:Cytochrome P450 n=1 Tax=Nasonia vitripennis TaxID=7425 RepID=A0A7M7GBM4_NASVI|nr:probable cytochrome P450 6a13 [Nasonia vitripennis]